MLRIMKGTIHILGPQREAPTLPKIIHEQYSEAKIAVISAGWRHEESELRPLARDLKRPLELLPLYQWFDELGQQEPALSQEHSLRQKQIKSYKESYRLRLKFGMDFLSEIKKRHKRNPDLYTTDLQEAQSEISNIDENVIRRLNHIRNDYPNLLTPWKHPSSEPFHQEIKETLDTCDVLLITGGHVAILRNRMFFFGCTQLLRDFLEAGKTIIAWSAGAMTLCDQIVLYYDDPPEGEGIAEVLDTGCSLIPNALFFPHARQRLHLDDDLRIAALAKRFHNYQCLTLEKNTHLIWKNGAWVYSNHAHRLTSNGACELFAPAEMVPS